MPLDQSRVLEAMNRELRSHVGALQMELLMAKAIIAEWERQCDALTLERDALAIERGQRIIEDARHGVT